MNKEKKACHQQGVWRYWGRHNKPHHLYYYLSAVRADEFIFGS